jgi:hypothetical protein
VEAVLVIIAILALVGGSAMLLMRQGLPQWTALVPRALGGAAQPVTTAEDGSDVIIGPSLEPTPLNPAAPMRPVPVTGQGAILGEFEPVRRDLMQTPSDIASVRLDRIETRLEELQRTVARQNEHVAEQARRIQSDLVSRAEAEEARREAALERLRADVLAIVSRNVPERQPVVNARRLEVSAELYAQLARLESALSTVTNPILLPGESYEPPAELLPETLIWENWNEVGERAFALAETYSAQRLHLSGQTRSDVGAFVTTLRTLLTRSVYPNVQGEADTTHQAALRAALAEIAAELPKVRDLLETEYLEGRST